MRITPWGNVGIGDSFDNALQPSRRLVVHERTDSAQFRIAWELDANPLLGQHADFQVTDNGVLHIKNRDNNERRPVVVGFLENEDANPSAFTHLDIGGVTRVRDLREDSTKTCLVLGTIADTTAQGDSADHYLTRLDFPGDSALFLAGDATWRPTDGTDCRWKEISDGVTQNNNMYMGFDESSNCYTTRLGVGIHNPKSKMGVFSTTERDKTAIALQVQATNNDPSWDSSLSNGGMVGLVANAFGVQSGVNHVGVEANSEKGKFAIGVIASASDGGQNSIGVYSTASTALSIPNPTPGGNLNTPNIAYYGEVFAQGDAAIYLVGGLQVNTGPSISISDENVKSDIENLANASEILFQLSPKTYNFISPENRPIALQEGIQFGLIAQEVKEVIPEIVHETTIPAMRDTSGNFIDGTSADLLGVNYQALIPILVAGFQEQNALITDQAAIITEQGEENEELLSELNELKTQMADMQNQVTEVMAALQSTQSKMNNCCSNAPTETGGRLRSPA